MCVCGDIVKYVWVSSQLYLILCIGYALQLFPGIGYRRLCGSSCLCDPVYWLAVALIGTSLLVLSYWLTEIDRVGMILYRQ